MTKNVFLKSLSIRKLSASEYPYSSAVFIQGDFGINFLSPVTIFCGANGSGKSTILKAIAENVGFGTLGGSSSHSFGKQDSVFGESTSASWLPKVKSGFYFRSDKLSDLSAYLDSIARDGFGDVYEGLGGKSLDYSSHGEAVLQAISKYADSGDRKSIVILDEPESALSPTNLIKLVEFIFLASKKSTQFVIASHSPFLLATPGADLVELDGGTYSRVTLTESNIFLIYRQLIKESTQFFNYLVR